jgi:large-conductance mechanosensitive channel
MIIIRFALISLIVYLIIRSFVKYMEAEKPVTGRTETKKASKQDKKVSKEIGEYIDYEEVRKQ